MRFDKDAAYFGGVEPEDMCTDPSCRNFGAYCRIHLTPEEPKAVKIKRESEKRKEQMKIYSKVVRPRFLKGHPTCQFHGCNKKATDIHHQAGRENERLLDDTKFMSVCRFHHDYLHHNSAWAIQNGYSISKHAKA